MDRFAPFAGRAPAPTSQDPRVIVVTERGGDEEWDLGAGQPFRTITASRVNTVSPPDVYLVDVQDRSQLPLVRVLARGGSQAVVVLGTSGSAEAAQYLDAGAADYISPNTPPDESLARLRAAVRRTIADRADAADDAIVIGALNISLTRREVRKHGILVHLTRQEFELLATLLATPNETVSHHKLLGHVWGPENSSNRHYLRIYMRQLRRKLDPDPGNPQVLVTVRGVGYLIRTETSKPLAESA